MADRLHSFGVFLQSHGWISQTIDPHSLNIYKDWFRPFAPGVCFGVIWLTLWLWCYFFRYSQRFVFPRPLGSMPFLACVVSFAIGMASFLSTDDIVLQNLPTISRAERDSISFKTIGWQVTLVILAALVPYLNPWKLLRSEPRAPGKLEKSLLNFGGTILLALAPFALVFYFSQEDLSRHADARGPGFRMVDFTKPYKWIVRINEDRGLVAAPRDGIRDEVYRRLFVAGFHEMVEALSAETLFTSATTPTTGSGDTVDTDLDKAEERALRFLDTCYPSNPIAESVDCLDIGECRRIAAQVDKLNPSSRYNRECALGRVLARLLPLDEKNADSGFVDFIIDEAIRVASQAKANKSAPTSPWLAWEGKIMNLRDGEEFLQQTWPRLLLKENLSAAVRARAARILIEGKYPEFIKQRSVGGVVLTWRLDQDARWMWAISATLVFLISGLLVNMNATSIHGFYRQKIAECFVDHPDQGDARFNGDKPADLLSNLDTVKHGGPYQLFSATLNLFNQFPWKLSEYSSAYTFTFSPRWCGAQPLRVSDPRRLGYRRTSYYCGGELDIPTVVAVSGAAFSPTVFRSPLLFFMSMLFNVRLGQWMPNPARSRNALPVWGRLSKRLRVAFARRYRGRRSVTMLGIVWDAIRTLRNANAATDWNSVFVSDGGHNDNLGISPLLFRRCRLMIVSDATGDPGYRCSDLLKTIRRHRMRSSIVFHVASGDNEQPGRFAEGLGALRPRMHSMEAETWTAWMNSFVRQSVVRAVDGSQNIDELPRSSRHAILIEVEYPEKDSPKAYLLYIKSSMTGDEPADLRQWQADNPAFPHDPTTDQFFTENQVESYRQLGEHIGSELCQAIASRLVPVAHGCDNAQQYERTAKQLAQTEPAMDPDSPESAVELGYGDALARLRAAADPHSEMDDAIKVLTTAFQTDSSRRQEIEAIVRDKIASAADTQAKGRWQGILIHELPGMIPSRASSGFPLWDWNGPIQDLIDAIVETMKSHGPKSGCTSLPAMEIPRPANERT